MKYIIILATVLLVGCGKEESSATLIFTNGCNGSYGDIEFTCTTFEDGTVESITPTNKDMDSATAQVIANEYNNARSI